MPPSRRRRLLACWVGLTLWLAGAAAVDRLWPPPPGPFATPLRVDLNRADVPTLMALPGIGRGRAEAIVLHRVRHGRFRSVDELAAVDGLGAQTVARLRPFLDTPGH